MKRVGVIGVQVNPQQGIPLKGIQVAIQFDVIFIAEIPGALAPRCLALINSFALQLHLYWHEVAVGGDQGADAGGLDVLQLLLHQMQDHIGARLAALCRFQAEAGGAITAPTHGLGVGTGREAHQLHLLGHHEAGVKPQAKMANDCIVFLLVLLQKIFGTGECHLIDIALNLIGGHADTVVGNGEGIFFSIDTNRDLALIALAAVAGHGSHAALTDGV